MLAPLANPGQIAGGDPCPRIGCKILAQDIVKNRICRCLGLDQGFGNGMQMLGIDAGHMVVIAVADRPSDLARFFGHLLNQPDGAGVGKVHEQMRCLRESLDVAMQRR